MGGTAHASKQATGSASHLRIGHAASWRARGTRLAQLLPAVRKGAAAGPCTVACLCEAAAQARFEEERAWRLKWKTAAAPAAAAAGRCARRRWVWVRRRLLCLALLQRHLQQGGHLWRHTSQLVPAMCKSAVVSQRAPSLLAPPAPEGAQGGGTGRCHQIKTVGRL